ncbi:MAG: peptidylprolyl isomerase [Tetragenococcus koreensis]|nr:peptidylprolyl isomerase [Tetragenococcus koreensis]MDN6398564.1 peptidylprolyl isomerase [Alkalibacterium sp.]
MSNFPQVDLDATNATKVDLNTNKGTVSLLLFPELAPKTVENFIGLAKENYYDGIIFHRVIEDFMIQGGDPTGTGMGGESIWEEQFEDEFSPYLFNLNGALSMANSGPNTNGSQFFIVTAPEVPGQMMDQMEGAGYPDEVIKAYREHGGTPWLDQRHTVFGHVVDGMDVVNDINKVETNPKDKPEDDVVIESIDVVQE